MNHRHLRQILPLLCFAGAFQTSADPTDSIVGLYARQGARAERGTGFWISRNGDLVTAYHVVQNATQIDIFYAGKCLSGPSLTYVNASNDLAILRVSPGQLRLKPLELSNRDPLASEEITLVGYPRNIPKQTFVGRTTSAGWLSSTALNGLDGKQIFTSSFDVVMLDVSIHSGMSGAPVLTKEGTVIGVLQGNLIEGRSQGWAVSAKHVADALLNLSAPTPVENARWPTLMATAGSLRGMAEVLAVDDSAVQRVAQAIADFKEYEQATLQHIKAASQFSSAASFVPIGTALTVIEGSNGSTADLNTLLVNKGMSWQGVLRDANALTRSSKRREELRKELWEAVGRLWVQFDDESLPDKTRRRISEAKKKSLMDGELYRQKSAEEILDPNWADIKENLSEIQELKTLNFQSFEDAHTVAKALDSASESARLLFSQEFMSNCQTELSLLRSQLGVFQQNVDFLQFTTRASSQ